MYQTNSKEWDLKNEMQLKIVTKELQYYGCTCLSQLLLNGILLWYHLKCDLVAWNAHKRHVSKNTMEEQLMAVVFVFIVVIIIVISYSQVTFQPKNNKCLAGFSATQSCCCRHGWQHKYSLQECAKKDMGLLVRIYAVAEFKSPRLYQSHSWPTQPLKQSFF